MDLKLKDKVVLISGSSRGLGKAIATEYLLEGAKVCLVARGKQDLFQTQKELQSKFEESCVQAIATDLSKPQGIQICLQFLEENFNQLDILVANVGNGRGKTGFDLSFEEWESALELNLISPALLMTASHSLLKKSKGNIVLISSIVGRESLPAPLPYSVSKLGLQAVTKKYSRLFAQDGIRVNMVCPGNILLPQGVWERKLSENKSEVEKYILSEVPLQRFATGNEVASAVLFLSSEPASFITGATLLVDGGQTRSFL